MIGFKQIEFFDHTGTIKERATFSCSRSRRLGSRDRGAECVVASALADY